MSANDPIQQEIREFQEGYDRLKGGLEQVIIGQEQVIQELLWAIFAG